MSRLLARPECFVRSEHERMHEIINAHPEGIFFYNCEQGFNNSRGEQRIRCILTQALPGYEIVVADSVFHYKAADGELFRIYPADMGTLLGSNFRACPEIKQLLEITAKSLQVEPPVLRDYLPNIVERKTDFCEGGMNIEVAGSNFTYTINPELEDQQQQGFCYLPGLYAAIEFLSRYKVKGPTQDAKDLLFKGHVDLVVSASSTAKGTQFFIYDYLSDFLKDWQKYGFFVPELSSAIRVPEAYVEAGGLNLKFIGDKVLAPSEKVVFPELLRQFNQLGMDVIELGSDQFNLANGCGVKCRSLAIPWRMK